MSDVEQKEMNIVAFEEEGYLQEVNRLVLHPLGLALRITTDVCSWCNGDATGCAHCEERGVEAWLARIEDYRDDPQPVAYDGLILPSMRQARKIAHEWARRFQPRVREIGAMQQPCVYDLEETNVKMFPR